MNTDTDTTDNPTEWGAMIGAAIIDPARKAEMQRKAEVKRSVESRIFCDCGAILDQQTAVCLVEEQCHVRSVCCQKCMAAELRKSLRKITKRYGTEHAQATITEDFSLIDWTKTTTGAEIWSTYSRPAPRRPKKPNSDRWMTPAQVAEDCYGWTHGAQLVIAGAYIMRPDAAGREKLSKRAPDGLQHHERFVNLISMAESWMGMIPGSTLTVGDTTTHGTDLISTAFLDQYGSRICRVNTQILRTIEHYCGAGYWCAAPPKESFIFYRHHSGATMALVMPLTDD